MPINERRRDDITAAVAAYDSANRRRGYRAPPHGCWPSCFPLRDRNAKARVAAYAPAGQPDNARPMGG